MKPLDIADGAVDLARAPERLATRLIVLLGLVLALIAAGFYIHHHGAQAGASKERTAWQEREAKWAESERTLRIAHAKEVKAKQDQFNETNREVSADHEKELDQVRLDAAADRADADRRGGLRIPAPAPACDRPGPGAEAAGTGGHHEEGASTVRLPLQVENDLWAIANDADAVSAQLRACQAWIVQNGFYGPAMIGDRPLLDRMIAAPNPTIEEPHD